MNKKLLINILFCLTLVLSLPITVPSQNIPNLPVDSRIKTGTLPNKINYYLSSNKTLTGIADFALVLKNDSLYNNCLDSLKQEVDKLLLPSNKLANRDFLGFVYDNDILPNRNGFVHITPDATKIVLPNVNTKQIDSILLSLTIILERLPSFEFKTSRNTRQFYSNEDVAILVSGDIDTKEVLSKLQTFSLMVPQYLPLKDTSSINKSAVETSFIEKNSNETSQSDKLEKSQNEFSYTFKRVPSNAMGTVQEAILQKLVGQLSFIVMDKFKRACEHFEVKAKDLEIKYLKSSDSSQNESLRFSVQADSLSREKAEEILKFVLSELYKGEITEDETELSLNYYLSQLYSKAYEKVVPNEYFIKKASSNFLYKANLSSPTQLYEYNIRRKFDRALERQILANFSSALLEKDSSIFASLEDSLGYYSTALKINANESQIKQQEKYYKKFPVRESKEPLSGGCIWTYKNGVKVVYKKADTHGRLFWSCNLNGGYSTSNQDVQPSLLAKDLSNPIIDSIPPQDLKYLIQRNDISFHTKLDYNKTILEGDAPSGKLDFLMNVLTAYFTRAQFENQDFFNQQFSKMNDACIVLVGDIEVETLKKALIPYIRVWETNPDIPFARVFPRQEVKPKRQVEKLLASEDGLSVEICSNINMTAENYYASAISYLVLRQYLSEIFNNKGVYFDLSWDISLDSNEELILGLYLDSNKYLNELNRALDDLKNIEISEIDLNFYKKHLSDRHAQIKGEPKFLMNVLVRRYVYIKDFETKYEEKIKSVNAVSVKKILNEISEGSRRITIKEKK